LRQTSSTWSSVSRSACSIRRRVGHNDSYELATSFRISQFAGNSAIVTKDRPNVTSAERSKPGCRCLADAIASPVLVSFPSIVEGARVFGFGLTGYGRIGYNFVLCNPLRPEGTRPRTENVLQSAKTECAPSEGPFLEILIFNVSYRVGVFVRGRMDKIKGVNT
jgi:hypothetical protein